jgi:hypothetical protein
MLRNEPQTSASNTKQEAKNNHASFPPSTRGSVLSNIFSPRSKSRSSWVEGVGLMRAGLIGLTGISVSAMSFFQWLLMNNALEMRIGMV